MPICNMCTKYFDVDKKPGAIMLGHPENVNEAVVWKAHLCQECEGWVVSRFQIQPKKFKVIEENEDE